MSQTCFIHERYLPDIHLENEKKAHSKPHKGQNAIEISKNTEFYNCLNVDGFALTFLYEKIPFYYT